MEQRTKLDFRFSNEREGQSPQLLFLLAFNQKGFFNFRFCYKPFFDLLELLRNRRERRRLLEEAATQKAKQSLFEE